MNRDRCLELKGSAFIETRPPARPARKVGPSMPVGESKNSPRKPKATVRPAAGGAPDAAGGDGHGAEGAAAAKLYRAARSAARAGMKDIARRFYERLVKEHPDSPLAGKAKARLSGN